jgi:PPE-repeat protein
MWAQDAAAMYGYAGSSAAATQLTPFSAPAQNTNPAGLVAQSAAVSQATGTAAGSSTQSTLSQLTSAVPSALQNLASPGSATSSTSGLGGIVGLLTGSGSGNSSLDSFWNQWGPNANIWNTIFSSGFYMPSNTMGAFMGLLGAGGAANAAGDVAGGAASAAGAASGAASALPSVAGLGGLGQAVSAGLGRAASLGPLSVPPSWTAVAPPVSPIVSALGGTPLTAPPAVAAGMPGLAPTGMAGRGAAVAAAADTRFLNRPPMVPGWSAVG